LIAASADVSALGGCSDSWIILLKLIIGQFSSIAPKDGEPFISFRASQKSIIPPLDASGMAKMPSHWRQVNRMK
jgi:hypothetical protein